MFGEIFGIKAGDACVELTLGRFLAPLGATTGVLRGFDAEVLGASAGLGCVEEDMFGFVAIGDGKGWNPGLAVSASPVIGEEDSVSRVAKAGFGIWTGSGSSKLAPVSNTKDIIIRMGD